MQAFLFICFGVGAGYTVLSVLLGEVIGLLDFDFEWDLPGGGLSPLKPSVIAAFLTVFGGTGLILIHRVGLLMALSLSATIALAVAFLLYRLVIVPLRRAQNTSAVEKQSLIGHGARVTLRIPQGRYGKITYVANGNTYSAPARAEGGGAVPHGAVVEIVYIDKSTYYVRKRGE